LIPSGRDLYELAKTSGTAWATQLAAARAGLLLPCLDDPQRAQLAQSITATINGHHMICDLTGADTELWDRVTAMWQHLLPLIATDPWLEHWRATDRAHPSTSRSRASAVFRRLGIEGGMSTSGCSGAARR